MQHDAMHNPQDVLLTQYMSLVIDDEGTVHAATIAGGVVRLQEDGTIESWLVAGWPTGAIVHRLQAFHGKLYACTDQGLIFYENERWRQTGIDVPCYQIRPNGSYALAATEQGLWCGGGQRWRAQALGELVVHDFISMPHCLVVAHETGILLFDRAVVEWRSLYTGEQVNSLAVHESLLMGVTASGRLITASQHSEFVPQSFDNWSAGHFINNGSDVYLCTDRGVFRLTQMEERLLLLAETNGYLVTDAQIHNDRLYMSTLFDGLIIEELALH